MKLIPKAFFMSEMDHYKMKLTARLSICKQISIGRPLFQELTNLFFCLNLNRLVHYWQRKR